MAKLAWKPWHQVVQLREDLKSGELPLHMFAADLYEVLMQSGKRPIYEKPENFFALTFPTHNLRSLVRDVVLRVAGKNDKAVRQLELTHRLVVLAGDPQHHVTHQRPQVVRWECQRKEVLWLLIDRPLAALHQDFVEVRRKHVQ